MQRDASTAPPAGSRSALPRSGRFADTAARGVAVLRRRVSQRLGRFAVASGTATVISQLTFLACYGPGHLPAFAVGMLAFVAGSVPAYVINRYWTWRPREHAAAAPRLRLVPYYTVMIGCALASAGLTALAGHLLDPLALSATMRTTLVDACYLASYGLLFVLKFVLLDRVVFARTSAVYR